MASNNRTDHYNIIHANFDVVGTAKADYIIAGPSADTIHGGRGNDFIEPEEGKDVVDGGKGDDIIYFDDVRTYNFEQEADNTDTIVFRTGGDHDTVFKFMSTYFDHAWGVVHDYIDLSGVESITGYRDLMKHHFTQGDGYWEIDCGGGDVLTLYGYGLYLYRDVFIFE